VSPVYFTDRDLGKQFPDILPEAGLQVERHADHFEHDTPDEVWLSTIGKKGWVAVTHDSRIRYKPNEKKAVVENQVALLVVVGHAPFQELARAFVATEPKIRHFIAVHTPPWIAKVYRPAGKHEAADSAAPGRVDLWFPKSARQ
jgi:hypothetical protein